MDSHLGTCILSLKIKESIYSYDGVPLISYSRFTSITIFNNINITVFAFFNILVDIQALVLH